MALLLELRSVISTDGIETSKFQVKIGLNFIHNLVLKTPELFHHAHACYQATVVSALLILNVPNLLVDVIYNL